MVILKQALICLLFYRNGDIIMISKIQQEILRLKKEKGITILAHNYVAKEIIEVADYNGDSFKLSRDAQKDNADTCIMCGVHFMAETAKILSPQKKVILAQEIAGCPMAEQFSVEDVLAFKKEHPDYTVVAYINTTAALKTVCDVCVTSASAVDICRKIENDKILFIPDRNLGSYVADMIPDKQFVFWNGGCPVHARITANDAARAKEAHPDALLLVHPECIPAVTEQADFIGSTTAIMKFAEQSQAKSFIIGTEISIVEQLEYLCPDKRFYSLTKNLICPNMKSITLMDVLRAVKGEGGLEIKLDADVIEKASVCINEMLRLG